MNLHLYIVYNTTKEVFTTKEEFSSFQFIRHDPGSLIVLLADPLHKKFAEVLRIEQFVS